MVNEYTSQTESELSDGDRELQLARVLGDYVDLCAAGEVTSVRDFISQRPHLAPHIAEELRALDTVGSVCDEEDRPVQFGDFLIIGEAGRGGMGIVYEAWQVSLDRRVALKILPASLIGDAKAVARFQREAKVAASLSHPNIVGVFAMGVEDRTPYFAMEFAHGETLQQIQKRLWRTNGRRLRKSGRTAALDPADHAKLEETTVTVLLSSLSSREAATTILRGETEDSEKTPSSEDGWVDLGEPELESATRVGASASYYVKIADAFAGAAEGVQHAHANGVIHRDLKPSNLILDVDGRLRILDFGVALVEGQAHLTLSRESIGTPLYMSPEQVRLGSSAIGPETDIYSLGATLYEMLAWRPPFDGRDYREVMERIANQEPRPLRQFNPRVPRDLETIVLKCLRKDPKQRYGTVEAFAQDLRRFVRGDPIEARPMSFMERTARRAWRSKRRIAEAVGVLALIITVALLIFNFHGKRVRQREERYRKTVELAAMNILKKQLLSPGKSIRVVGVERIPPRVSDPIFSSRQDRSSTELLQVGPNLFGAGPSFADVGPDLVEQAVSSLAEAVGDFPDKPVGYYHLARGLLLQGKRTEAREVLQRARKLGSQFPPVVSLWAWILEKEGSPGAEEAQEEISLIIREGKWPQAWFTAHRAVLDQHWREAAESFDRLGAAEQGRKELYLGSLIETKLGMGVARLKTGDLSTAIQDFGAGLVLLPEWIEPALFVGKVHFLQGNRSRASRTFRDLFEEAEKAQREGKANGRSPDEVARSVATIYRDLGDFEGALHWCRKIGKSHTRLLMSAEFLYRLGRLDEALMAARNAQEQDPDDLAAVVTLGNVLVARGEFESAQEWYLKAMDRAPEKDLPKLLIALGLCLEADGKLGPSSEKLRSALDHDPDLVSAHYNLARVLGKQGDDDEAIEHYLRVIELDPGNALAFNNVGTLFDRQGLQEDARRMYQRAAELAPMFGAARYNLGYLYAREKRYAEAAVEYQAALQAELEDPAVYRTLAACLQYQWKLDEAVQYYEKAIDLDPEFAKAYHDIGTLYDWQDKLPEAIRAYRKAVELEPEWVTTHNELGWALDRQGARIESKKYIEESIVEYREAFRRDRGFVWAYDNLAGLKLRESLPIPEGKELSEEIVRLEDAALLPLHNRARSIPYLLEKYRAALAPDLASYASIDAVFDGLRNAIPADAVWRIHRGTAEPSPGLEWTEPSFDDASWETAPGPFARRPSSAGGDRAGTVLEDIQESFTSLYLRKRFDVRDPARVRQLLLSVRVQSGVVVHLNGAEVGRVNAGSRGERHAIDVAAGADTWRPWSPRHVWIDPRKLREGENVVALRAISRAGEGGSSGEHADFYLGPVLKIRTEYEPASRQALEGRYKAFQAVATGPDSLRKLAYFEGRLLQLDGKFPEAGAKFAEVLALDRSRPEPFLRRAECVRDAGDPAAAEGILRQALDSGLAAYSQLWKPWLRLALMELGRSPRSILDEFPAKSVELQREEGRLPADIYWLVERLEAQEPIRINCGGKRYSNRGITWGRDRFFRGGFHTYLYRLDDEEVEDRGLYQTERYYEHPGGIVEGYSVPLPKGTYSVTLHFAEGHFREAGKRRFDVLLEGKRFLTDYEPLEAGFGIPDLHTFMVHVTDGALDIDFERSIENPKLSAFEIERR